MKKFFDDIEQRLHDAAIENDGGDFFFSLDTGKYRLEMSIEVACKEYDLSELLIIDEDDKDVSSKFPLLVERLEDSLPYYNDIVDEIEDSMLSETERIFGSEANYLHYRFG